MKKAELGLFGRLALIAGYGRGTSKVCNAFYFFQGGIMMGLKKVVAAVIKFLLKTVFTAIFIGLFISTLLIAWAYHARPMQLFIGETDMSWLVYHEKLVFSLTVIVWGVAFLLCRNYVKEKNEQRFTNKILAEKGLEPLNE